MQKISFDKASRLEFMRKCAVEGMVLLKDSANNLPLGSEKIAVFGRSQIDTIKGGTGSGFVYCRHTVGVLEGIMNSGINYDEKLAEVYTEWVKANPKDDGGGSAWGSGKHFNPEMPLNEEIVKASAGRAKKAVFVIGRISGENSDMTLDKGDYYLTDDEDAILSLLAKHFKHIIVILNTGSPIDTSFMEKYGIETLLYMGQAGEESGSAVAMVLSGEVNPSGKLTVTWANKYEDYPSPNGFFGEEVVYNEGIYVGYRYFDSFGIEPKYPFGFGLSYTKFALKLLKAESNGDSVIVKVAVKNTGKKAGKEVVQIYSTAPDGIIERPYQELRAFHKTDLLAPGESEELTFTLKMSDFAGYSTEKSAYVLDFGSYFIRIGTSSRNIAATVRVDFGSGKGYKLTRQCKKLLTPRVALDEFKKPKVNRPAEKQDITVNVDPESIITEICEYTEQREPAELKPVKGKNLTLIDVRDGKCSVEDVVAQMNNDQLSRFANGYTEEDKDPDEEKNGAIIGAASRTVWGAAGETWYSNIFKMPSSVCADGPAGLRLNLHSGKEGRTRYCSAFPIGMLLAGTWCEDIAVEMGRRVSRELKTHGIDGILGPGINIIKNPLCGRCFEYFSEDPYLAGKICAAEVTGVQRNGAGASSGTYATIKHLAANSQENFRVGGNSVVSERAMREIYLKAFEIAVKDSQPYAIMTSYNMLNGVYTANEFELCSDIVRSEWGFEGVFMTDWGGKEEAVLCMTAGNDLIMAGWKAWYIKEALDNGSLARGCSQRSVVNVLKLVMKTNSFKKLYRSEKKK